MTKTYQHQEAYCLMLYRAENGEEELIWNSRDGVTPFFITLRSGESAKHVEWHNDLRTPEDFVPIPGSRMFVDMTPERAKTVAEAWFERFSANSEDGDRERIVPILEKELSGHPDLIEVP